jgi:hypothetical protein
MDASWPPVMAGFSLTIPANGAKRNHWVKGAQKW